ncbi:DUF1450 domain-containing protein [Natrinema sp. CGMCC1.2065]|uniref:DUF1450 domain-containing protein n=1 Tax=Natrinema sp. CGMCC1.2065 TaxID=3445767 RepID=UPI003F4A6237
MAQDGTGVSRGDRAAIEAESGVETTRTDVECCIDNVDVDSYRAIKDSNQSVNFQYCLQRCGTCYKEPFFVIDGDVVTGTDHLTLLNTLDSEGSGDE